ncbi:DUF2490 domain-containing protein [Snuella lapsa]|uniref:DUF2490 domain-containing protein n=1 Tax=Snuella lapsa TaxID=870481 RepID=A0ABP6WMY0_9FLAO
MKYNKILIIFLLSVNISFAQTPIENQLGSWFTYVGNYRISEKVSISNCVQSWHYEIADNFNFLLTNVALNYHISSKLTTSLSYGFMDIDKGFEKSGTHSYENRLYEQIGYKHKLVKLPIDHRFRIEQRLLNKPSPSKNVMQSRLRYRLGTKLKLNKTFFIRLNNEVITTIKTKSNDGFTENRAYGALGINLLKSANVQVGYLNRKIKGLDLHRLQIGLFYKVDFRK